MATETVQIVIDSLVAAGVKYVFGVPGAKIDSLFNALVDHPEIQLVVCRHEQNAAFIAAAVGKLTDVPGVCIATSGPGTSNLVTGLLTANDEGSPVVAIVGSTSRAQSAKRTHQSLRAVELLTPVTKKVVAAVVPDQVSELMVQAFRVANTHPRGATVVTLPIDIMTSGSKSAIPAFSPRSFVPPPQGPPSADSIDQTIQLLSAAKFPIVFLGARAADQIVVARLQELLRVCPIPVIETFQAAGAISKDLVHLFYGRVGLFRNQPGDKLLQQADLVLAVGYDQAEYDAVLWNTDKHFKIVHIDNTPADLDRSYEPVVEMVGDIASSLEVIKTRLEANSSDGHSLATLVARPQETEIARSILKEFQSRHSSPSASPNPNGGPVHPLHFIRLLQAMIEPSTTVISDVGSVYIWLSRYFYSYNPYTFLVSNVQQTLGVGLPWAIGASLSQQPKPCTKKVVSISGDGGFLFSSQELVTAVQLGCNITHFIWNDGKYNMVEFQEVEKYGRSAGVDLGGVDFKIYAEAFGAKGMKVTSSIEMEAVMKEALAFEGVCVVDIEIDYSDNHDLMAHVISGSIV